MTPTHDPLAERMSSAARELQDAADPRVTLEIAVRLAVLNVAGCDAAAITIARTKNKGATTPAYTHPAALACDNLQYELDEGPCLTAAYDDTGIVHSPDLTAEDRWPKWGPQVIREFGIGSILCLRLFTHDDLVGALNLYSFTPRAYDVTAVEDGSALAAQVAVAYVSARRIAQLHEAMDSRTAIAAAVGIIMARYDLSYDRAFAVLGRISSEDEMKIRDVANQLLTTGKLHDVD